MSVLLVAAMMGQAPPVSEQVFHSSERVLLLEDKGETSAGVSVGDLNGNGLLDIVLGKGHHWTLYNRVLLNDGKGGFFASNQGTAPDQTYSAALTAIGWRVRCLEQPNAVRTDVLPNDGANCLNGPAKCQS